MATEQSAKVVDLGQIQRHECFTNLRQVGNEVICDTAHHSFFLPHTKMLVKNGDKFEIVDVEIK